nr:putative ribonuclease H-like domain-containing protein [Tanacetum cinerariifolium]
MINCKPADTPIMVNPKLFMEKKAKLADRNRYLKGTAGHEVLFRSNGHLNIQMYTDAVWAGDKGNRRSTSGYFSLVGGNLVTWRSKKQKVVSLSSAEAEFRGSTQIMCDNKAAIQISENPVQHDRTKHVEVDQHFIKEKLEPGIIELPFIKSSDQLADILTKAVGTDVFHKCLSKLNFGNPTIQLEGETKLDEVIPFEKQSDDLKKKLKKNYEAKMVIYNALPKKEYERIFMRNTEKEIWKTLLITHQDESIDSVFTRFNTIIMSLKALDEGYSSKNYVRKFLRALNPKWREKVTAIEESKDLTSLSLDELIRNLKVHEMIIKKDFEIVKAKVKRKSLALKAKKESSDEECSTSESEDEEYAMATFQRSRDDKNGKSDRKCFRCGDLNHLIGECPNPSKDKNQRAFVGGSWSDSGEEDDEKVKNEMCLVAQASSEICLGFDLEPDEWIKDSGCSKHMTSNRKLFSSYKAYNRGNVIFGRNLRGNIIGKGQICDNKCRVTFSEHDSEITKDGKVISRGYSQNSKAYVILNKHTRKVKESLNVTFDETPPSSKTSPLVDDDLDEEEEIKVTEKKNLENDIEDETLEIDEIVNIKESRNHPLENVIGHLNQRTFISQAQNQSPILCLVSAIVPAFKRLPKPLTLKRLSVSSNTLKKKQTALAIFTTEAKYISTGKACQQALWMKQVLIDYNVRLDDIPIMCDNKGAIDLRKNPVQHSRTKHIKIRHHFLRDNV